MKDLVIVRGLPGSGKSTFAYKLSRAVCTADDFVTRNSEYKWSQDAMPAAHAWCLRKCERFMKADIETVVVANVFVKSRDFRPYVNLAKEYGYRVFTIVMENRHGNSNVHGVDDETMNRMDNNFQLKLL